MEASPEPDGGCLPMRWLAYLVLIVLVVPSCASRAQAVALEPTSPCSNPTYTALKSRPVDELSEREYELLRELERACAQYQITREEQRAAQEHERLRGIGVLFLMGVV